MTTIVNSPREDSGSAVGLLIGIVLAIILAVLFFVFGLPYLRGTNAPATNDASINVTVPDLGGESSGTEAGQ